MQVRKNMRIEVVIPAYNEEKSIANVIQAIPKQAIDRIIVVNNASTDQTAAIATSLGAYVIHEPQRGYGKACLSGIAEAYKADVIVFVDADFSDDPSEMIQVLEPILHNNMELVIGSRILGKRERGALPFHANFGNRLACFLIHHLFGYTFTDLGPFRAITKEALDRLDMKDETYGWTVEMQTKAALHGLRCCEVPVSYRRRVGKSKISGTISGSIKAGTMILYTIFLLWIQNRCRISYNKNQKS
jgi:glycosyltransferase involved in cell wall biosynthesis